MLSVWEVHSLSEMRTNEDKHYNEKFQSTIYRLRLELNRMLIIEFAGVAVICY